MSTDDAPLLLLISKDLFFSSQIEGTACGQEMRFRTAVSLAGANQHPHDPTTQILVDLDTPGLDFEELAESITSSDATWIGYASHVKTHLFEAAQAAGLERLYSRGEISARLAAILNRVGSRES